jgi:hypothetical protein
MRELTPEEMNQIAGGLKFAFGAQGLRLKLYTLYATILNSLSLEGIAKDVNFDPNN